jgi:hypothetical protein
LSSTGTAITFIIPASFISHFAAPAPVSRAAKQRPEIHFQTYEALRPKEEREKQRS